MLDRNKYTPDRLRYRNDDFPNRYDKIEVEALKEIIEKNPKLLNMQNDFTGTTLLIRSVQNGNYNIAEYLLENGADPNLQSCNGDTALHQAILKKNHKLINLLLEKEASTNIRQQVTHFLY